MDEKKQYYMDLVMKNSNKSHREQLNTQLAEK
jgi:hypothetical protein